MRHPIVLAVALLAACWTQVAIAAEAEFVDHGGPELSVAGPICTPIQHKPYFVGDREQFGYNPRYVPCPVTFGPDKRPYIWTGKTIITLDDQGKWISLETIKGLLAKYTDLQETAHIAGADPHIGWDSAGDAYIVGRLGPFPDSKFKYGLFHSTDACRSWTFYETPSPALHTPTFPRKIYTGAERLERLEAHNQIIGPPPMVEGRGRELTLYVAEKTPDGKLTPIKPILVAPATPPVAGKGRNWITPAHSGCGNVTATFDGKTHVIWLSIQPLDDDLQARAQRFTEQYGLEGLAPCYAATYDHKTGTLSDKTFLCMTRRDNHNGPVISVDSKGYLHVIIGAHTTNFFYMRSLKSNSTTGGWTEPEPIGDVWYKPGQPPSGGYGVGYTYTAFLCDQNDTLHLAARLTKSRFLLVYLRKKLDQPWEPFQVLVSPFRTGYCAWRQKINIDRLGRLFINYDYYPAHLRPDEVEAYRKKWPEDQAAGSNQVNIQAHNPCILISDDDGDTWRLALTQDFIEGIKALKK